MLNESQARAAIEFHWIDGKLWKLMLCEINLGAEKALVSTFLILRLWIFFSRVMIDDSETQLPIGIWPTTLDSIDLDSLN